MVNKEAQLDVVFHALADSTRRGMLARLARGSTTIGELGRPYAMTKGAVSKHVKVLEQAGLLRRDVQGRIHQCDLETEALDVAEAWVQRVRQHWEARLDDLSDYLDELQGRGKKPAVSGKPNSRRRPR